MELTYRMEGESETQFRMLRVGDAVRNAIQRTMLDLVTRGVGYARSAAPKSSQAYDTKAYRKYGSGRLAAGINGYVQGDEFDQSAGQVGLSKRARKILEPLLKDEGDVAGVILSQWYTGAFYERGFPEREVLANKPRGIYYRAYQKAMKKARKGTVGPLTYSESVFAESAAVKAGKRAVLSVTTYRRKHHVDRRPFMAPARDLLEAEYRQAFKSAIDAAVGA